MADHRPDVYWEGDRLIIRASSFGGCIGSLVRCGVGITPEAPPKDLVRRWAEGTKAEPLIVNELRARGMMLRETEEGQAEYELHVGKVTIRCHPDGISYSPNAQARVGGKTIGHDPSRVVEIKALRPSFDRKFPPYLWQASIEMAATGLPLLWVYGTKDEEGNVDLDQLELVPVDTPYYSLVEIKRRALQIYRAVVDMEIPACDRVQFPCGYWTDPDAGCSREFKAEAKEREKAEIEDLGLPADVVERYRVAKDVKEQSEKDFKEIQEHIKGILKDRPGEKYQSHGLKAIKCKGSKRLDKAKAQAAGINLDQFYKAGEDYWRIEVE